MLAQIASRTYRHLGEGIDFGEVERMRGELEKAIKIVGRQAACDSARAGDIQEQDHPHRKLR